MSEEMINGFSQLVYSGKQDYGDVKSWNSDVLFRIHEVIHEMRSIFLQNEEVAEEEERLMTQIRIIENDIDEIITTVKYAKHRHAIANVHDFFGNKKKEINIEVMNNITSLIGKINKEIELADILMGQLEREENEEYDMGNELFNRLRYIEGMIPVLKRILHTDDS
jgi:hypothetical protein